jgi:DNA-binding PadR family transcriptional regulator
MKRHFFFILLSLAGDDRHGSGIMRDVLDLTEGELKLWPATLYGSLDELRALGFIRELDAAPRGADAAGHKRWFRITPPGRRAVVAELARLRATVRVAERRLVADGGDA